MTERRAPVQADKRAPGGKRGTVAWYEHQAAWEAYAKLFGREQSAERIAERQGFSYGELVEWLGHPPRTWRAER